MASRREPYSTQARASLAAGAVAVSAANVLLAGPYTALLFNLGFWAFLLALLRAQGLGWRDFRYLLPLPALYYVTFAGRRGLSSSYDMVLGADAARYLKEAAELTAGVRHLGYAVITWPYVALSRAGRLLGPEISDPAGGYEAGGGPLPEPFGLGVEYLHLQSALIGAIAVVLLARILGGLGAEGWRRWGIAYGFGLSFSVWMLAGVLDPQIVSVMLLLLLLLGLLRYLEHPGETGWLEPCAICTLAVSMSIENLYMPLLFGVAWWMRRRPRSPRDFLEPALFALALAVALGTFLLAAAAAAGPRLYTVDMTRFGVPDGIVSHLRVFTTLYLEIGPGLAPAELGRTAAQVFVMAVRAQPGVPVDRYRFDAEALATPANGLYAALMVALVIVAAAGLRRHDGRARAFIAVLVAGLVARQAFVSVYDRWESVLFSLPSLALLWLLLGIGIAAAPLEGRRERLLAATLMVLLALLIVSNAAYVLDVPTRS